MVAAELFACEQCPKSFDARGKFNQHLKTHSKPWACELCPRGFALRTDLARHIKARHRVGNIRYECPYSHCDFKATRKDNLSQHVKRSHPVRRDIAHQALKDDMDVSGTQPRSDSNSDQPDSGVQLGPAYFMHAASTGNIALLQIMLRAGNDINIRSDDGYTALHCAARAGQLSAVQFLLERDALVAESSCGANKTAPIHEAVLGRSPECFAIILQAVGNRFQGLDLIASDIVLSGDIRFVEVVMAQDMHEHSNESKANILAIAAARAGSVPILKYLLAAHPRLGHGISKARQSPLFHAVKQGQAAAVHLLLSCLEGDGYNYLKGVSLRAAVKHGHHEIAQSLLEFDGSFVNMIDDFNLTPLQYAIANRDSQMIALLSDHPDLNVNVQPKGDEHLNGALHLAAKDGNVAAIELLLKYRQIDTLLLNAAMETPLGTALWSRQSQAIQLLLQHTATSALSLDFQYEGKEKGVRTVAETIKWMLDAPTLSINSASRDGQTLLHLAAEKGDVSLMRVLLNRANLNLDHINKQYLYGSGHGSQTALGIAGIKGHEKIVRMIKTKLAVGIQPQLCEFDLERASLQLAPFRHGKV